MRAHGAEPTRTRGAEPTRARGAEPTRGVHVDHVHVRGRPRFAPSMSACLRLRPGVTGHVPARAAVPRQLPQQFHSPTCIDRTAITDIDAIIDIMASLIIRDLDAAVKERLRVRAARNRRSMEEEARIILRNATSQRSEPHGGVGSRIHQRFAKDGGVELELPRRDLGREPPDFK